MYNLILIRNQKQIKYVLIFDLNFIVVIYVN